jgi:pyridoxal phosphate enzyme (YggS family)
MTDRTAAPGPGVVRRNIEEIRSGIARGAERAGRDPADVSLIAVTKTVPSQRIRWAVDAGVRDLGENYVQELRSKREDVPGPRWHFVGTLQSGTAHLVADHADVVQTVAGERAARRLAGRAARSGRELPVLIEVDLTEGRAGVRPDRVDAFAAVLTSLAGLRPIGLMTMPPQTDSPEGARSFFDRLRRLRDEIRERHPDVLELSMGMSLDYEVAVEEGATMVRIGTALFGSRSARSTQPSRSGATPETAEPRNGKAQDE